MTGIHAKPLARLWHLQTRAGLLLSTLALLSPPRQAPTMRSTIAIALLAVIAFSRPTTAAGPVTCAEFKQGANAKQDRVLKVVPNQPDRVACQLACASVPDCTNFKYCARYSGADKCSEKHVGGPPLHDADCVLGAGAVTPTENDPAYSGITLGINCVADTSQPGDTRFTDMKKANIQGDVIATVDANVWDKCADACLATEGCTAINLCYPASGDACEGGLAKGKCDLKRLTGPVGYWSEGDASGFYSGYKKTYEAAAQPR